jgi:hypothetical protein
MCNSYLQTGVYLCTLFGNEMGTTGFLLQHVEEILKVPDNLKKLELHN